jgi:putative ATPase
MPPQTYYEPSPRGFEAKIAERIAYWEKLRAERRGQ